MKKEIHPANQYGNSIIRGPDPKIVRLGELAIARSLPNSYGLPKGLPEGVTVKLTDYDVGTYEVEFDGRKFRVAGACIQFKD